MIFVVWILLWTSLSIVSSKATIFFPEMFFFSAKKTKASMTNGWVSWRKRQLKEKCLFFCSDNGKSIFQHEKFLLYFLFEKFFFIFLDKPVFLHLSFCQNIKLHYQNNRFMLNKLWYLVVFNSFIFN